ncbi:hypothetical protein G7K_6240-t1 [Saitoella complicata NRRL Y-17804]|uniref:Uncharacterized protein n=1 Tax=Saitoella complicata (strain BCRC 22490 / CBS 7301 / JCM 7358 / NBRC 10748 / NRRL Y-17804) TaxID=698492 RepID=A0A0E9NQM8_SAICN|nr:hypothetical protein G7K_6240-t1 [Saitoella complicata NRRL Y-17804]
MYCAAPGGVEEGEEHYDGTEAKIFFPRTCPLLILSPTNHPSNRVRVAAGLTPLGFAFQNHVMASQAPLPYIKLAICDQKPNTCEYVSHPSRTLSGYPMPDLTNGGDFNVELIPIDSRGHHKLLIIPSDLQSTKNQGSLGSLTCALSPRITLGLPTPNPLVLNTPLPHPNNNTRIQTDSPPSPHSPEYSSSRSPRQFAKSSSGADVDVEDFEGLVAVEEKSATITAGLGAGAGISDGVSDVSSSADFFAFDFFFFLDDFDSAGTSSSTFFPFTATSSFAPFFGFAKISSISTAAAFDFFANISSISSSFATAAAPAPLTIFFVMLAGFAVLPILLPVTAIALRTGISSW